MRSTTKKNGIEMSRDDRIRLAGRLGQAVDVGTLQGLPGLRRKRIQKFRTQKDCAIALNIDRQTYNSWELGKHWPPAKMLPGLASTLGCTIEDLFLPDEESEGY